MGELELDAARHVARRGDRELDLTAKEFALLRYFMTHAGQVLSQERLLEHVWDEYADPFTNTVRVTVGTLRRKLGGDGETPADRHGGGTGLPPRTTTSQPAPMSIRLPTGLHLLGGAVPVGRRWWWAPSTWRWPTPWPTSPPPVVAHQVQPVPGQPGTVTVAPVQLETAQRVANESALDKLRTYSFAALLVLFAVSFGVGWLVAGYVLRPIGRITKVAREITATDLSRRIDLRRPRRRAAPAGRHLRRHARAASTRPSPASASSSRRPPTSCATRWP